MREILYRGKDTITKQWVYGGISQNQNHIWFIIGKDAIYKLHGDNKLATTESRIIEVQPETIGRYTDKIDINNIEIFEGDIVKWKHSGNERKLGLIHYDKKKCGLVLCSFFRALEHNRYIRPTYNKCYSMSGKRFEIIGNKYNDSII